MESDLSSGVYPTKEIVMEYIRIENLSFQYDIDDELNPRYGRMVIDDFSLSIKKGEFVAILGHNGSGKSTIAKQLNAMLTPTK